MSLSPEKIPPYNEQAERAVLGSVLMDHARVLMYLRGKIQLSPDELYVPQHKTLLRELYALDDEGKTFDILIFQTFLKERGTLESCGGEAYLEQLIDDTPTAAHAEHYANLVRDKYLLRCLREQARSIVEACDFTAGDSGKTILGNAVSSMSGLSQYVESPKLKNVEVFDAVMARFEHIHARRTKGEAVPLLGLETPFSRLNELYCGLQPGLHFIGGPPSTGKTTFTEQTVEFIASTQGPVTIFSLDDTREDWIQRSIARIANVSLSKLHHGFATARDIERARQDARQAIEQLPIQFVEDARTVEQQCAIAKMHRAKYGTVLFTFDYVQIIGTEENTGRMQEREVIDVVCGKLKFLWQDLKLPLVVLSQVQRENYKNDSNPRKASMADLFGGASLEHTASSALILKGLKPDDLPAQPIDSTGYNHKYPIAAHVVKNKKGPKDQCIPLWLHPSYFRFDNTPKYRKGNSVFHMTWEEDIAFQNGGGLPAGGAPCTP